ncbi:MAG: hypothetical protein JWO36_6904 [Myxococcales bacterium]|nr:hypothetical protein [Myxococcales bacterium]
MRLSIHVSPLRTSFSTSEGTIPARTAERSEEIAQILRAAGTEMTIVETAVRVAGSNFSLVFANDLSWYFANGGAPADGLVVLHADRDQILPIAEQYRVTAAIYYIGVETLNRPGNGLVVRRQVADRLGGTLGPGLPYFRESEHYASWRHPSYSSLAEQLVGYLRACLPRSPVVVSPDDAVAHGAAPLEIRVDARAASMELRTFVLEDLYIAMSGPPGAPIGVAVWDCTRLPFDIETAIRSKHVPPWAKEVTLGHLEHADILDARQPGMTFKTGGGIALRACFGFLVKRPAGTALVALAVRGIENEMVSGAEVLSNSMIAKAIATLEII